MNIAFPKKLPRGFELVDKRTPEQKAQDEAEAKEETSYQLMSYSLLSGDTFPNRCKAQEQLHDYFPEGNEVPTGGGWVLVKTPPNTEFTVPPLSLWFAEPWPHRSNGHRQPHRVRVVTPRGDLGLYPREYSLVKDPAKFYEFLGEGMEMRFFSQLKDSPKGIDKNQLFYIRSRGISLQDAVTLLLGEVKAHSVCWIETSRGVCESLGFDWPNDDRLATVKKKQEEVIA